MLTVALILLLSGFAFAAQSSRSVCSMGADVEHEYESLPSIADLSLSWEQRYGPRRTLAAKYPTNWPLQLALQVPLINHEQLVREWDLAIEHYRSVSDPLLRDLLEARLLAGFQPAKSRETFIRILGEARDSPWAHLAMLESAADPRNGDGALAEQEYLAFRRMCPGDRLIFRHFGTIRDPATLEPQVRALRAAIEAAKQKALDEEDFDLLRTVWTFERITYGKDHLNEFENIVRSDLAFLRDHPRYESPAWLSLVLLGHRHVSGDAKAINSLYDEVLRIAPHSEPAYQILRDRWTEQNPAPAGPALQPGGEIPRSYTAASEAYSAKRAAFLLPLIERFRGNLYVGADAREILNVPGLPAGTFERLADLVLSDAERYPDQEATSPPLQMSVAESYVARKVRLERVPALVSQAIQRAEDLNKYEGNGDAANVAKRRGRQILIEAAIASGQTERAHAMLADFRRDLDLARASAAGGNLAPTQGDESIYEMLANRVGIEVPPNP